MSNPNTQAKPVALWQARASRKIIKRIVATGTLILETPAHFGTGEQSGSEMIILQDTLKNKPLIPGASIAGALRHYLYEREFGYRNDTKITEKTIAGRLFGTALNEERGQQSRVIVDDALGEGQLTIRDGVMIDDATHTADDGALFTIQVWERGTNFKLNLELVIYHDDKNPDELEHGFATALQALANGEINLGARKHRGYGRAKVDEWNIQNHDMSKPQHLSAWLTSQQLPNTQSQFFKNRADFKDKRHYVRLSAKFNLLDSLIIRAGSDVADVSHLTSKGKPVVSGTSIAGALRARALKIANLIEGNTIDNPQKDKRTRAEILIDSMFGAHGTNENKNNMSASRLLVEEHLIENPLFSYIQNRVKIDRFTGGTFDTALFDEQPVFAGDDTIVQIDLTLRLPFKHTKETQAEIGLLMLLLKDLWTEDLPLGGEMSIGRGRLQGKSAEITWRIGEEKFDYDFNERGLQSTANANTLQDAVNALWDYTKGNSND